ncbi:ENTH-domain-containing protein [Ascodesmis nigricans]|uniref:ENTH-domain-containing protein n=1 Tax=Ascodesmis nigricans TaxID=341454 RepID=A0A4V3SIM4_9PEZI|nr:ENTH-domain-containing protein [Ascodesmis nigricans]
MDALRDAISNVSLYEVKAAVRKAQNVVMNYTEMEAKVREATNNEPWGASSTLMNEIASGTYDYQLLNEIMPMIYRRFTEKSSEEWRQIYKALQLLEFLIKNGAEQVIDDARAHLSTIKMLRQFHYIDQNGKDQGVNVRNRAKELSELLSDVDRIRAERKKARVTKNKYGGVEGGSGYGSGGISGHNGFGRRYGGFGSDQADFGGYSGGVYGDGGGFSGGSGSGGFQDSGPRTRQRFEEYDEDDDNGSTRRPAASSSRRAPKAPEAPKPPPPKKEPEIDLFSFDDPIAPPASNGNGKATMADTLGGLQSSGAVGNDDDDFDDFQSAAPVQSAAAPSHGLAGLSSPPPLTSSASGLSLAQPKPVSTNQQSDISSLVGLTSPTISAGSSAINSPQHMTPVPTGSGMASMSAMKPMQPSGGYQPSQPNYFTSVPVSANTVATNNTGGSTQAAKKPAASNDPFANIWNNASAGLKKSNTPTAKTPSLQAMAQEKASAGIWGTGAAKPANSGFGGGSAAPQNKLGGGLDDLLS